MEKFKNRSNYNDYNLDYNIDEDENFEVNDDCIFDDDECVLEEDETLSNSEVKEDTILTEENIISDKENIEKNIISDKKNIEKNIISDKKNIKKDIISDKENIEEKINYVEEEKKKIKEKKISSCFSSSDWASLHLSKPLLKALRDLNFECPTKIQKEAIPFALQGRDVLGTAQTGSGKTAAFLLPVLERSLQSPAVNKRKMNNLNNGYDGGTSVTKILILLPTRELAVQCSEMLSALTKYCPITYALIVGGMSQKNQEMNLKRRPDIIIATPGRVLDLLLNSPNVHIELLEIIILDEADRLLELGFKDECLRVLKHCSGNRQTLLFSATLSEAIKDLAVLSLRNPIRVDVTEHNTLPNQLEQVLVPLPNINIECLNKDQVIRESLLLHLCIESYPKKKTIIFFRTKKLAHRAALIFNFLGIKAAELHGNLPQNKRLEALEKFHNNNNIYYLISSELVARGLDIANVDLVINISVPPETSRYIHQVGRTARIGRNGIAITLFSREEKLNLKRIIKSANKKSNSNIIKRIVCSEIINKWINKINNLEDNIKKKIKEEIIERQTRLAEMEIKKIENLKLYENEIMLRPKKHWIQTSEANNCILKNNDNNNVLLEDIEKANNSSDGDDDDEKDTFWDKEDDDEKNIDNISSEDEEKNKKIIPIKLRTEKIIKETIKPILKTNIKKSEKNRNMKKTYKQNQLTKIQKEKLKDFKTIKNIGKSIKKKNRETRTGQEFYHCGDSDNEIKKKKKRVRFQQ